MSDLFAPWSYRVVDGDPRATHRETALRGFVGLRTRLVVVDIAALLMCWAAMSIGPVSPFSAAPPPLGAITASIAVTLGGMTMRGLYLGRVASVRTEELVQVAHASMWAAGTAVVVGAWLDRSPNVAGSLVLALAMALSLIAGRSAFDAWLRAKRERGQYCRSVLVAGGGAEADQLARLIGEHRDQGWRVVGHHQSGDLTGASDACLGYDDVIDRARSHNASGIILTTDGVRRIGGDAAVKALLAAGIHVHLSVGMGQTDYRRLRLVSIAHVPLLYVEQTPTRIRAVVKRGIDLAVAPTLLVLTAPLLAICALAIKASDRGPVLYRQPRVGRGGVEFNCLKLRTMAIGADSHLDDVVHLDMRDGPLRKMRDDPRVTRVGRVLRALSIDELPQLINVIRREMSLVGPRPALPSEVEEFDEELLRRHQVAPGITGLWQVEARDLPEFNAYRRLDLFYVENWSIALDLVVIVLTVEMVLARAVSFFLPSGPVELTSSKVLD